jgi:hypothetical protein
MIVATTNEIPGYKVVRYIGLVRGITIGANLPIWILICTFSWRLAKMALDVCRRGMQGLNVGLGDDGIDERFDNHAQQAPSAVFYAAARWGESPRCSAMSGSVNNANKR